MSEYWQEYWNTYPNVTSSDEQRQVGRTRDKHSVSSDTWEKTLGFIVDGMDIKPDVAIALDCADQSRIASPRYLFQDAPTTICIDHHITNAGFAKINLIDVKDDSEILAKVPANAFVFALCIEGKQLTSEEFSQKLEKIYLSEKKGIYFIIGGSDGLSQEVKSIASMKLSMSEMTFPHRLAKIMLLEQLYRALSIQNNRSYHK